MGPGNDVGLRADTDSASETLDASTSLWIAGEWRESSTGATFQRRNPADGTLVGTHADATLLDVQHAISAARNEFDHGTWPRTSSLEKAAVFRRAAQLARDRKAALSELVAREVGKPLADAGREVDQLAAALDYCAGAVFALRGEAVTRESDDGLALVVHEPVGVVAAITSYNFPVNLVAAKVPYALAAGCTVVLKPSELSVATAVEVARTLLDAGLPANALQVVSTTSTDASRALVLSADVDKVAFTGSTATGRAIMRDGAATIKRLTLELGGKGPIVVFDDADLDAVEGAIFSSIFQMAGQVCTAGSRLLVHESIHEEMTARVRRVAEAVVVGHPLEPTTTMGPLAQAGQVKSFRSHVAWAVEDGATLITGGDVLTEGAYAHGHFVTPTIFDDVPPQSRLAQQEVFGPILAITPFASEDEAIALANGTEYGLKATVWTRDGSRLLRMLKEVRAGMVMGNTTVATVPQVGVPFGGYKQSGLGREYGSDGIVSSFMETKTMFVKL